MISRTNTRSQPIGYTSGTAFTLHPSIPLMASSTNLIKSGCVFLIAMTTSGAIAIFFIAAIPVTNSSLCA